MTVADCSIKQNKRVWKSPSQLSTHNVSISVGANLNAGARCICSEVVDRQYVTVQAATVYAKYIVVFSNSNGAVASEILTTLPRSNLNLHQLNR